MSIVYKLESLKFFQWKRKYEQYNQIIAHSPTHGRSRHDVQTARAASVGGRRAQLANIAGA